MRSAERSISKRVYLISTCLIALWGGCLGLRDNGQDFGQETRNLRRLQQTTQSGATVVNTAGQTSTVPSSGNIPANETGANCAQYTARGLTFQSVPSYQIGSAASWVSGSGTIPEAQPAQAACCPIGTYVTGWSVESTAAQSWVGAIEIGCSNSQWSEWITIKEVQGCPTSPTLKAGGPKNAANPQTYSVEYRNSIWDFLHITGQSDLSTTSNTFQCPTGTTALGFTARPACTSLTDLKVLCGVVPAAGPAAARAPSTSNATSPTRSPAVNSTAPAASNVPSGGLDTTPSSPGGTSSSEGGLVSGGLVETPTISITLSPPTTPAPTRAGSPSTAPTTTPNATRGAVPTPTPPPAAKAPSATVALAPTSITSGSAIRDFATNVTNGTISCSNSIAGAQISGGAVSTTTRYPYAISMRAKNARGQYIHACGAVAIASQLILTAAHCCQLKDDPVAKFQDLQAKNGGKIPEDQAPKVYVGATCIGGDGYDSQFIESVLIPSAWTGSVSNGHDLCVMKMAKPFDLSSAPGDFNMVYPMLSNTSKDFDPTSSTVAVYKAIGWGLLIGLQQSPQLREAGLSPLLRDTCKKVFENPGPDSLVLSVTNAQICTQPTGGNSTCKGDSGGPLIKINSTKDTAEGDIIVGIVSAGDQATDCGKGYGNTLYSNVNAFNLPLGSDASANTAACSSDSMSQEPNAFISCARQGLIAPLATSGS